MDKAWSFRPSLCNIRTFWGIFSLMYWWKWVWRGVTHVDMHFRKRRSASECVKPDFLFRSYSVFPQLNVGSWKDKQLLGVILFSLLWLSHQRDKNPSRMRRLKLFWIKAQMTWVTVVSLTQHKEWCMFLVNASGKKCKTSYWIWWLIRSSN